MTIFSEYVLIWAKTIETWRAQMVLIRRLHEIKNFDIQSSRIQPTTGHLLYHCSSTRGRTQCQSTVLYLHTAEAILHLYNSNSFAHNYKYALKCISVLSSYKARNTTLYFQFNNNTFSFLCTQKVKDMWQIIICSMGQFLADWPIVNSAYAIGLYCHQWCHWHHCCHLALSVFNAPGHMVMPVCWFVT